jgi:hypothetical protein
VSEPEPGALPSGSAPDRFAILVSLYDLALAYAPRAPHDDSVLDALRSRTGDAAFERAWARGRSFAGAQAVSYALEEAGRPSGL